jgi:polysaccharide deacetylase family protein (PEP-CTERM system associated)
MNAFTVDLEEWFQGLTSTNPLVSQWPTFASRIVPATETLLALLHAHEVQATFFVLGYIADQYPGLIERIYAAGHEIGVHGYYHRFVFRLSPEEFAQELAGTIAAITRVTGERPLGHRAPYFSFNSRTTWAFAILQEHGFQYDSSIFPARSLLYGYPDAPRFPHWLDTYQLMEFPISTVRLGGMNWPMAGGFYGRLLPYPFLRWAIKRLNQQGQPAIFYLHPWELDLGQQQYQVTFRERITHYHGRQRLAAKLEQLLTDFRFTSLRSLLETQFQRETAL